MTSAHTEQARQTEAVDKSQLPAFLFRPVPVKAEPQDPEPVSACRCFARKTRPQNTLPRAI